MTVKGSNLYESNMFGIELMRILSWRPQVELETYKMRNKNTLVLVHIQAQDRYEVTIYLPSDIEDRSWIFFLREDAKKKFDEIKKEDQSPLTETGAKR
jgi:hypothetical protein